MDLVGIIILSDTSYIYTFIINEKAKEIINPKL